MIDKISVMNIIPNLNVGGAERLLLSTVPQMDCDKFQVCVCSLHSKGDLLTNFKKKGIEVISLGWKTYLFPYYILKLALLMRKRRILIVHNHLYPSEVVGTLAGIIAGTRYIVTTKHGEGTWMNGIQVLIERLLSHYHKLIICDSEAVKKKALQRGMDESKTVIVYPSNIVLDETIYKKNELKNEYHIPVDSRVIGCVGRFHPVKGHKFLMEAFAKIRRQHSDCYLVLVGRGVLDLSLRKMAEGLGIAKNVRMVTFRENINEVLAIMDIFVLSSVSEGFPISVLDAMAMKKAVIATNVGGVPEVVIPKKTGLVVPPGSSEAICDAILYLLKNDEVARSLGENAFQYIKEHFTLRHTVSTLQKSYQMLLPNLQTVK